MLCVLIVYIIAETYGCEDCSRIVKFLSHDIAQEMLTTFNDDPDLLGEVITGDKSWVYGNDIKTKAQSFQ